MPNEKQPGTPLPFEEVRNFRDLGGWEAGEGRRVKYGLLYRAPQLDEVRSSADRALLESLGLPLIDEALTDTMDHLPYFQETD